METPWDTPPHIACENHFSFGGMIKYPIAKNAAVPYNREIAVFDRGPFSGLTLP